MLSFLKSLVDDNYRLLNSFKPIVAKINALEADIKKLSDQDLSAKTPYFKELLKSGKTQDHILPEAYAVCREAIFRTIGERAYDVQLLAAIALHRGAIAEQRTGEGKTHSVIFPAYLNSLSENGVHIITPNDYLTRVGTGWYPRALNFLGISTACIVHEQSYILDPDFTDPSQTIDDRLAHLRPISRKEAYSADVTYGTNNEFGFDYLRDHMAPRFEDKVQRPVHHFAIVDEVDFVLIDEARTPLIISSPNNQPTDKYYQFSKVADQLQPTDYSVDEKYRSVSLSEFGIRKVEKILNVKNLYEESFQTIHYVENAIKAKALFHKDKDYVVADGQIIIVDEFTGRLMHGRRWSDGLHQAVEAKEGLTVQQESQTWATITFQNYFRLYQKLAGMTGTASTEAEEFKKIYNLDVITIPTYREKKRLDYGDLVFKNQRAKYAAIASKVEEVHSTGQPILIGTTSIEKNEIVASVLRNKRIPFQMLNAKNHQSEAEIIAKAGKLGSVTVATNMAGRGVDIILGGPKENKKRVDWQKEHDEVVSLGGLFVIGTERHESRRIDNQLRGRAGRQGDPGSSQFYIALDDDLMRIFGGDKISQLMTRFNMPENEALTHPLVSKVIEQIQVKVEGHNFDMRKSVVEYDDVINKQRQIVYRLRDDSLSHHSSQSSQLWQNAKKCFDSEITHIINTSLDPLSQQPNFDKIHQEFSEIIPLLTKHRQQLESSASINEISQVLNQIVEQAWQTRQQQFGHELSASLLNYATIKTLDPLWVDHLTSLDDLRDGVRLRGYAQRDPLIEYRKEGYEMFQQLLRQFEYNFCRTLFRLEPVSAPMSEAPKNIIENRDDIESQENPSLRGASASATKQSRSVSPKTTLSRNDPCWCGSGKKWKKCHYPAIA